MIERTVPRNATAPARAKAVDVRSLGVAPHRRPRQVPGLDVVAGDAYRARALEALLVQALHLLQLFGEQLAVVHEGDELHHLMGHHPFADEEAVRDAHAHIVVAHEVFRAEAHVVADELLQAGQAAAGAGWLDHPALREIALAHDICPYYLAQEMMRWCDVAIGDYHHVFDPGASWLTAAEQDERRVALLVDEAHHLIGRAREMHSATLDPADFQSLRQSAPPGLHKTLDRMHRHWNALAHQLSGSYTVLNDLPADFLAGLRQTSTAIADHLAQQPGDAADAALMGWFFEALRWLRLADGFGNHSVVDLQPCARPLPRA